MKILYVIITFNANNLPTHLWRTSCTTPPLPFPITLIVSRSSNENSKSNSLKSEGCSNYKKNKIMSLQAQI